MIDMADLPMKSAYHIYRQSSDMLDVLNQFRAGGSERAGEGEGGAIKRERFQRGA
jgi:hypothetical protein